MQKQLYRSAYVPSDSYINPAKDLSSTWFLSRQRNLWRAHLRHIPLHKAQVAKPGPFVNEQSLYDKRTSAQSRLSTQLFIFIEVNLASLSISEEPSPADPWSTSGNITRRGLFDRMSLSWPRYILFNTCLRHFQRLPCGYTWCAGIVSSLQRETLNL